MSDRFVDSPSPTTGAPAARLSLSRLLRWSKVLEPLSVAGLFVYLLWVTWMRWGDPLIDFPRDLYIAWRLSEGDLLYQQIANWYGPLANLIEGVGFRIFGAGLDVIVWMNIVFTIIVLLLLRSIFGMIGNRLSVWLGSVVFLIVFAFGHLTVIANYNYITPYVAQSTYSLLGLLLVLWGLLKHLKSERFSWLAVAGLGICVTYLDKPEAVLAAGGAVAIFFLAQLVRRWRLRDAPVRWGLRAAGWMAGGFLSLWLAVFAYFWTRGGLAYAWMGTNYLVATVTNSAIRNEIESAQLMQKFIGFDHPWQNFVHETVAGALMVLVCGGMVALAQVWTRARKLGLWSWASIVGVAGLVALGAWLGMRTDGWLEVGPAFGFPVILAALAAVIWNLRLAWRDGEHFSRALGLAVVGVAASLMLVRMILNVRLGHYGFFMMPLAVWFWINVVVVEGSRSMRNNSLARTNWLLPTGFAAVVVIAAAMMLRFEVDFYRRKTFAVGEGRDRFYTFPPLYTKFGALDTNGLMLNTMITAFNLKAPHARTLVAFPEGIAVNYHLRVRSPLAELEFQPLSLGYMGLDHILAELQENPPDAVLVSYRNMSEFGVQYFGQDEASGRFLMLWVQDNYILAGKAGQSHLTMTRDAVDIYIPKVHARPPLLNFGPF